MAIIKIKDFNRKLSAEEVNADAKRMELCNRYELPYLFLASSDTEHFYAEHGLEDFEVEALRCIDTGEKISQELEKKLMDTLEERKARNRERELRAKAASAGIRTAEDIKRVTGVDFEKRTYFGVPFEETELFGDKKKGQ